MLGSQVTEEIGLYKMLQVALPGRGDIPSDKQTHTQRNPFALLFCERRKAELTCEGYSAQIGLALVSLSVSPRFLL